MGGLARVSRRPPPARRPPPTALAPPPLPSFDPANLGADPKALRWYAHAEVIHGRWAMLGAAGVVGTSALHAAGTGVPEWYDAGKVSAENTGIPLSSLLVVQMILMHFVEIKRLEDFKKPGSQSESGSFFGFESSFKGTGDPSYPGGAFDPLGLASGPPAVVDAMKTREIKNGRLAMVACLGFAGQHGAQPDGPIANLARHLANPPQNCFATNGVSLPALF